jgi:hypothetical protein
MNSTLENEHEEWETVSEELVDQVGKMTNWNLHYPIRIKEAIEWIYQNK